MNYPKNFPTERLLYWKRMNRYFIIFILSAANSLYSNHSADFYQSNAIHHMCLMNGFLDMMSSNLNISQSHFPIKTGQKM